MRTLARVATALASVSFFYALNACGSSASDSAASPKFDPAIDGGTTTDTGTPPVDTGPPPPPPEKEVESSYRSPVATGKNVWIANPKSGRVAYIDAASLDVKVVEAGNGPTYMAAVPSPTGDDVAIVLNVLSEDATLLRKTSLGLTAKTFATHHGANAWQVSSDGHWAIAWTDAKGVASSDKTAGFQDLTVIDLTEVLPPTILAVGYRPVSVGFTKDGAKAYAVTQDGISIIDLAATGPLARIRASRPQFL
ncbi:MAG: YncE family protein [Polyangiales bacterium]